MALTDPNFAESLVAQANAILQGVVSTFAQQGVELPGRQYIHVGQAAHDCEQVVVSFEQMYIGRPGEQAQLPQKCDAPRSSVFAVQITRKVAALGSARGGHAAPTAEALAESARIALIDAYVLFDAGLHAVDDWGGILADISVTDPQGAFQSVVMNLISVVP